MDGGDEARRRRKASSEWQRSYIFLCDLTGNQARVSKPSEMGKVKGCYFLETLDSNFFSLIHTFAMLYILAKHTHTHTHTDCQFAVCNWVKIHSFVASASNLPYKIYLKWQEAILGDNFGLISVAKVHPKSRYTACTEAPPCDWTMNNGIIIQRRCCISVCFL